MLTIYRPDVSNIVLFMLNPVMHKNVMCENIAKQKMVFINNNSTRLFQNMINYVNTMNTL